MHFPLFNSNAAVVVLTHMLLLGFFSCLFLFLDFQQNRNRSSTFSSTDKEKKQLGQFSKTRVSVIQMAEATGVRITEVFVRQQLCHSVLVVVVVLHC